MLNNRGQSLVLFIIILPVLLFILVLVIDIGKVISLNQELNNISELVLDYGIDKLSGVDVNNIDNSRNNISDLEKELVELIKLNKDDIDMFDVRIENNRIYINLGDKDEGILSRLVNIDMFNIKSSYVGYMDNDNKRIERISGD